MIECKEIRFSYTENSLFNQLNIKIKKGEFVTIKGESGRGKSTLLKMIQGYVIPDSGSIIVDGLPVSLKNIEDIRNKIIWIPQNINLPVNTALELIELLGIEKHRSVVIHYLQSLGLDATFITKPFSKISGGQKQRIIIAIGLSLPRPVILLDEPTSALDEETTRKLIQVLKHEKNKTILSVSHNNNWLQNCDRVIDLPLG